MPRRRVTAARSIFAVDSHTEGMPTRVDHRRRARAARRDDARAQAALRGRARRPAPAAHAASRAGTARCRARSSSRRRAPDADWGVLFIEVRGCLPMCGHGTIGVATVLVETGMVEVTEPETTIRLDTPAGLVEVRVDVEDGRATGVTLRNVPVVPARARARASTCPASAPCTYDMAFGGNFYALARRGERRPRAAARAARRS